MQPASAVSSSVQRLLSYPRVLVQHVPCPTTYIMLIGVACTSKTAPAETTCHMAFDLSMDTAKGPVGPSAVIPLTAISSPLEARPHSYHLKYDYSITLRSVSLARYYYRRKYPRRDRSFSPTNRVKVSRKQFIILAESLTFDF